MTEDIAVAFRAVRESVKDKLSQMPPNVDANGFSDLDRELAEAGDRARNQGWTQEEITEANAAASISPTGMRPNPAQGGSAGGVPALFSDTVEGRIRDQVKKTVLDGGVTSR